CGAVLADPYDNAVQEIPSVRKKKPLSKTIEISPSKKRKCPECGNILLDDETKCPLCGYE
ncbi:MAG TPA: zinc-ribbon domain-containing protein, partial [Euryarchaeota archaeon]|nr:zinc-ribbon domain-containing protein [Euryarchaeota archaeon]